MNLILLEPEDFIDDDAVRLVGRRARHIRKILRAEVGDILRVGLLGGDLGTGRLTELSREACELQVELAQAPPPPLDCALVLALPRPPALRRILKSVTALGVKRIALIDSARVEQSFWQSTQLEPAKLAAQMQLGLEQARDTLPPEVTLHRRFARFVDTELPEWIAGGRGVVGHAEAPRPCPCGPNGAQTLIVGPEGGFLDDELAALELRGVEAVSLGPRPLSVETAVTALLARFLG